MNLTNCFRCNYRVFSKLETSIRRRLRGFEKWDICNTQIFSNNYALRYSADGMHEQFYGRILGSKHDTFRWYNSL